MLTHLKHIFMRPKKCPYFGKWAYFREMCLFEKWKISHLRYSLYRIDSSIIIGIFVYDFRKKIFWLKKIFPVFLPLWFFVGKIRENMSEISKFSLGQKKCLLWPLINGCAYYDLRQYTFWLYKIPRFFLGQVLLFYFWRIKAMLSHMRYVYKWARSYLRNRPLCLGL